MKNLHSIKKIICLVLILTCVYKSEAQSWSWAKSVGGLGGDDANEITLDNQENVYVIGSFSGTLTLNGNNYNSSGSLDVYIIKYDKAGNFKWVATAGGTNTDIGLGVATNNQGDIFITGVFEGTASFGGTILNSAGNFDVFVARLDSTGNWQWAVKGSGIDTDLSEDIIIDPWGDIYITGVSYTSINFGNIQINNPLGQNPFICKLNSAGSFIWAEGVAGNCTSSSIQADNNGKVFITGEFQGSCTFGTSSITSVGVTDIYVACSDSAGNWQWAKRAGSISQDVSDGLTIDNGGGVYLCGYFSLTAFFGPDTLISAGGTDFFVAKINDIGNWVWAMSAGGSGNEEAFPCYYGNQKIFIAGSFSSGFNLANQALTPSGGNDVFVCTMDTGGNFLNALSVGSATNEAAYGVCSMNDNLYITGVHTGSLSFGNNNLTSQGSADAFVAKYSSDPTYLNEFGSLNYRLFYPNPINSELRIQQSVSDNAGVIKIYNLAGDVVLSVEAGTNSIDVSSLSPGFYFIMIGSSTDSRMERFVKL